jgi:hypothetical protein
VTSCRWISPTFSPISRREKESPGGIGHSSRTKQVAASKVNQGCIKEASMESQGTYYQCSGCACPRRRVETLDHRTRPRVAHVVQDQTSRPEDHRLQVESFQRMSDPAEIQGKASRVYKNAFLPRLYRRVVGTGVFGGSIRRPITAPRQACFAIRRTIKEVRSQCDVRKGQFTGVIDTITGGTEARFINRLFGLYASRRYRVATRCLAHAAAWRAIPS